MSEVVCLTCSSLDLQLHKDMAVLGFGQCRHSRDKGKFNSVAIMRHCDRFTAAREDVTTARQQWMERRKAAWQQKQTD